MISFRELKEEKNKISVEEIIKTEGFESFMSSSSSAIMKAHKRTNKIPFRIYYKEDDNTTAYTDGKQCVINAGNSIFIKENTDSSSSERTSTVEACERIIGAAFHELGHVLYTCNSELARCCQLFEAGTMIAADETLDYLELKSLLQNEKNGAFVSESVQTPLRSFIVILYKNLLNIVEDGRIENLLFINDYKFSGFYKGLWTLREAQKYSMINKEYERSINDFFAMSLLYAKYGKVGFCKESFPEFDNAKEIIDKMLKTHKAISFSKLNQDLLICAWPLFKDLIKEMEDNEEEVEKRLKDLLESMETAMSGAGDNSPFDDSGETEIKEADADISESMPSSIPDPSETTLESTLDRIMKDIADNKVREKKADESNEEIRKLIGARGKGFEAYRGTEIVSPAPEKNSASFIYKTQIDTKAAVNKASKEIKRHLEQDMRTGTSKRKFSGKKFHASKLVNNDFRYFENKARKKDMPQVKVGLLIDESGSMSSNKRYEIARKAAITLYDIFEKIPNLDIAIYGHSDLSEVNIYTYTDFGVKRRDIRERLCHINARGGNIDIVPFTVMAESLLKQDADTRIMFVITDGLPYSYSRDKSPEEELSEAANKYTKKGIDIIVASIGEDEDRIREIYKKQRFLDISSSSELPKKMVDIIKRKM